MNGLTSNDTKIGKALELREWDQDYRPLFFLRARTGVVEKQVIERDQTQRQEEG